MLNDINGRVMNCKDSEGRDGGIIKDEHETPKPE
jgi:hypothetical protein